MRLTRRSAIRLVGAAATAFSTRLYAQGKLVKEPGKSSTSALDAANRLVTYPFPEGLASNPAFVVRVRSAGKQWQDVVPYSMEISKVTAGRSIPQDVSAAYFDFTGTVEVSITPASEKIDNVRIRPASLNIAHTVKGNTITFSLAEPRNLSVEVNGDIFHNLHLFAGAPETKPVTQSAPNVLYFGPGIHTLTREQGTLASGQTLYISGGAVVRGAILLDHVENVRILGRGVLDQSASIKAKNSKNIQISGVITAGNMQIGQCEGFSISNTKTIRSGRWGDGIDFFCCKNVTLENAFLRTSDDCIAIYGHRWDYYGDTDNIKISKCILWADVAHPILIGTHGNSDNPNVLENISFHNIDILDQHEEQIDYQGCMSLNAGDSNLIRNVLFEDIRIENFRLGQLVNLRVFYNKTYNTSPGRGIEGVVFRNVSYSGTHANLSIIAGYDETHKIKNVVFENLQINGVVISDDMADKPRWYKTGDIAGIFIGEHVEGLKFIRERIPSAATSPN